MRIVFSSEEPTGRGSRASTVCSMSRSCEQGNGLGSLEKETARAGSANLCHVIKIEVLFNTRRGALPKLKRTKQSAVPDRLSFAEDRNRDRIVAVLVRAKESGLTASKGGRISGRVSPELIERAKARTGLQSDTELVEFALANIAIEDDFAQVFRALKGTVDPDLDLGF